MEVLKRRIWTAVTLFSVVLTVTVSLIRFLPNIYTASTFIVVENQQIPSDFVRSTVTTGVKSRLHTISQEILSRSRLRDLVTGYSLYRDLWDKEPTEEVIEAMRNDIGLNIRSVQGKGRGENTIAFEVSYNGSDPRKVMLIANRLGSFYIEENLKVRQKQALGTEDFMERQLGEVKEKLEKQEEQLAKYRHRYLGELPEQLDANLKTLGNLQARMETLPDALARARDRRESVLKQIEQVQENGSLPLPEDSLDKRIAEMKRVMTELQGRVSDRHPDMIRLKSTLAVLEEEREDGTGTEGGGDPSSAAASNSRKALMQARLQARLKEVNLEVSRLVGAIEKTQKAIAVYRKRIDNMPKHEQALLALSRDHGMTRELYVSLLRRSEQAQIATSLEQRQKAERFRILDPAIYPETPSAPRRLNLFLAGLLLSIGAAVGGIILKERMDSSFHRVEDLQASSGTPVLVTIPPIGTPADRWRGLLQECLRGAAVALLLIGIVGASYLVASGNQQLVKLFGNPTRGIQLRN